MDYIGAYSGCRRRKAKGQHDYARSKKGLQIHCVRQSHPAHISLAPAKQRSKLKRLLLLSVPDQCVAGGVRTNRSGPEFCLRHLIPKGNKSRVGRGELWPPRDASMVGLGHWPIWGLVMLV